jgi:hypothetical protein
LNSKSSQWWRYALEGGGIISPDGKTSPPITSKLALKSTKVEVVEMVEIFSTRLLTPYLMQDKCQNYHFASHKMITHKVEHNNND